MTATIYQKVDDVWQQWDAASMDQENPQVTTAGGIFAWDVPEGDWKVKFVKDGYEDVWSQVMHVLPEWTNVAINMLRADAPAGTSATVNADDEDAPYVDITFNQYMKTASGFTPTVTVGGVAVTSATWIDAVTGTDEDGNAAALSRVLRVPLAGLATPGVPVEVVVSGATSYAGKTMESYSATVTVPAPEYYYVAPDEAVAYTKGSTEPPTFTFKRTFNDDRTFGKFTGILVDGKEVAADNYAKAAGSVIIAPTTTYLDTLSEGSHVLTAQFADGSATADFTVNGAAVATKAAPATKASSKASSKAPATGDRTPIVMLGAAALISACVLFLSGNRVRRKLVYGKHARR